MNGLSVDTAVAHEISTIRTVFSSTAVENQDLYTLFSAVEMLRTAVSLSLALPLRLV